MNRATRPNGLMQATIVVANRYPLTYPGDTGALKDLPSGIIGKIKGQPVLAGTVIGAATGHFLLQKHGILGAVIGAAIGYYVRSPESAG